MSMSMSMSCGMRQELSQRATQELLAEHRLSLRLKLIQALRDVEYTPAAVCPKCNRDLKAVEVIRGFNNDPNDFTTLCPGCGHRFNAKLMHVDRLGHTEMPFFCASQTLNLLKGTEGKSPAELKATSPAVYHSAIVHHGTLKAAFGKIGVLYKFDETLDWKSKIRPFLGRLPDTVIAKAAGISAKVVARQRKLHKVPRCTRKV